LKALSVLNSIHYGGLRAAAIDFNNSLTRERLDAIFNREIPYKWMQCSIAKLALNLISLKINGPPMSSILTQSDT